MNVKRQADRAADEKNYLGRFLIKSDTKKPGGTIFSF